MSGGESGLELFLQPKNALYGFRFTSKKPPQPLLAITTLRPLNQQTNPSINPFPFMMCLTAPTAAVPILEDT